jgi:hypothetical protein
MDDTGNNPDEIPEGVAEAVESSDEPLDTIDATPPTLRILIGDPFALASGGGEGEKDIKLFQRDPVEKRRRTPNSCQGCIATVSCVCGQVFVMDLTTPNIKRCPKCDEAYTSLLIIAAEDDDEIMGDAFTHLKLVNEELAAAPDHVYKDEDQGEDEDPDEDDQGDDSFPETN